MRDQCRWFGGMVGNHVADIVARYGESSAVPAGADRLHQGPRGLRLQPARPGRQHPHHVRARRDRRPVLHPRPGRGARSSGCTQLRDLGVDQFAIYLQHDDKDHTLHAVRRARHPGTRANRRWPGRDGTRLSGAAAPSCAVRRRPALSSRRSGSSTRSIGPEERRRGLRLADPPAAERPARCRTVGDVPAAVRSRGARRRTRRSGWRCSGTAGTRSAWPSSGFVLGAVVRHRARDRDGAVQGRRAGAAARTWCISQTVPLIALAPAGRLRIGRQLGSRPKWTWVGRVLGAFLAFFPIAVATLKGLQSAPPASLELMDSYAASVVADAGEAAVPGGGAVHGARR